MPHASRTTATNPWGETDMSSNREDRVRQLEGHLKARAEELSVFFTLRGEQDRHGRELGYERKLYKLDPSWHEHTVSKQAQGGE